MKKALAGLLLIVLVLSIPLTSFAYGVSVIVPDQAESTVRKVSTKTLSFRFEVKNTNPTKAVKYYEVTYYTCDEFYNQNGPTTTDTLKQDIMPYETIMSSEVFLKNAKITSVCAVCIAITGVRYADGTYEYDSDPTYTRFWWTWN
ncbi:MAG: hypothetical protein IJJ60_06730 [Clostridia bacterium]|nr:hypothetical protein [Clostridia bacterium]